MGYQIPDKTGDGIPDKAGERIKVFDHWEKLKRELVVEAPYNYFQPFQENY